MTLRGADIILVIHAFYVVGVALPIPLIVLGAFRNWHWIRNRTFRRLHLAMILLVVMEDLLHIICPLTAVEAHLRGRGGRSYPESWMGTWVSRFLYHTWSPGTFLILYVATAVLVVLLYFLVPPKNS